MEEKRFQGKTVLVTGSSGGIGRATALGFASEGAALVLTCNHNRNKGEETLQMVRELGVPAWLHQADLSDAREAGSLVSEVLQQTTAIDILINNAGTSGFMGTVWDTPVEEWDRLIRTNLYGAFYLSRLLVPGMIQKRWGRVINISSIGYRRVLPNMASYLVSKSALNSFTKALSKEAGPFGITVNAIAPGQVSTERILKERLPGLARELGMSEEAIQQDMLKDTDTRRFSTVEDVAELALFLASDKASNITGSVIDLSGGL